jgi:hypothetical protein
MTTIIAMTIKMPKSIPALNIPDTTLHEPANRDTIKLRRIMDRYLLPA